MIGSLSDAMREIFANVQFNKTSHQGYEKKLRKLYERQNFDTFSGSFISCLVIPLTKGERNPNVENVLEFAAKFAVSLTSPGDEDESCEQMCPFLRLLFDFVLTHHNAKDQAVRFRICHFLNMLLNFMGEDASVNDDVCDKITETMMARLMDKSPKVRAQAVFALHRLQEPTDDNCRVIRTYIFHLSKDPNSEVRKAVLSCMAKNKKTLQAVLKRTRDVNESVRKMAYQFISKVTVRSLTIKQREGLLNSGLKDKSSIVRRTVEATLLPSWLHHFEGDYTKLLRALDAEIATDTAILALNALLKRAELTKLMEQLPVDSETKLIPLDKLTSEIVLYWRCLVEHLHRESCTEQVDECIPELSNFCAYIRRFINIMNTEENEYGDLLEQQFILCQLFEMTKSYDLGDEIGRKNLSELMIDALMIDNCSQKLTVCIVNYFETVVPNVDTRLQSLVGVISEIRIPTQQSQVTAPPLAKDEQTKKFEIARLKVKLNEIQEEEYDAIRNRDFLKAQNLKEQIEAMRNELDELSSHTVAMNLDEVCEEKNDRDTMLKCLAIMYNMTCAKSVTTLTSTLRSLLGNLVLPSLEHDDTAVYVLTLKALANCCLLDEELAKEHIMMYFCQFSLEQQCLDIWIVSLQVIFDLLLHYGLETFGIVQSDDRTDFPEDRTNESATLRSDGNPDGNNDFVKIVIGLLDNREEKLRTIATEGLCKLLLHGRISGPHILSRLIILLHNPISQDDFYLRHCLCGFFKIFVSRVPDSSDMLEQAFLPTLKTLANAPEASPLQAITAHHVAEFIIGLTSSRNHKPGSESYAVHNNLALAILAESLDHNSEIDPETLLKSLKYLDVRFEDNVLKDNVREAADKIIESMDESDKRLIKYVQQFKSKFDNVNEETQQNQDQTQQNQMETQQNQDQTQRNDEGTQQNQNQTQQSEEELFSDEETER